MDVEGRGRWRILLVLFLARVTFGFQFQSLAVTAPIVFAESPLDHATLGFLVGVYMLPGVVLALPGGVLGQRFGDKRVAIFGLLLMALGGALVGATTSTALITTGRVLSGGGAVLLNVCVTKMLADWFIGREIVFAAGVLASSWSMGVGLSLILLPLAAAAGFTGLALYLPVLLGVLSLLLVALAYRAPGGISAAPAALRLTLSRREWSGALLSGLVWGLFNVGFAAFLVFTPDLLTQDMSSSAAAATVSLVNWSIIVTLPLGGHLAWLFGSTYGAMIASLVALAVLAVGVPMELHAATVCVLFGLVSGPVAGLIMALPGPALEARNRAAGMGAFFMVYHLCMAGLMPLAGLTRDLTGNPFAPLYVVAGMMLVAVLTLITFRIAQRR